MNLDNDLIIIELEDLEVDPDLQAVVMTLMIHQITKDMYLSDPERKRPKLLLVDEGWRLLGDKQSGGFISKAFRTVRKYRGSSAQSRNLFGLCGFGRSPSRPGKCDVAVCAEAKACVD